MRYLLSGDSLVLDQERCTGCRRCLDVCPHAVFASADRKVAVANRGDCMQCGACRMNCPEGAIEVSTGVGCAAAVVSGLRRGRGGEARCDCG
jgi:NAD-dependent dihydropyrimidine dehydrogenase PreA subunit